MSNFINRYNCFLAYKLKTLEYTLNINEKIQDEKILAYSVIRKFHTYLSRPTIDLTEIDQYYYYKFFSSIDNYNNYIKQLDVCQEYARGWVNYDTELTLLLLSNYCNLLYMRINCDENFCKNKNDVFNNFRENYGKLFAYDIKNILRELDENIIDFFNNPDGSQIVTSLYYSKDCDKIVKNKLFKTKMYKNYLKHELNKNN